MGIWARRAGVLTAGAWFFVLIAAATGWAQTPTPTGRRDCSDFTTQQQAQQFFTQNGGPQNDPFNLDVDNDGQACEGLPGGTSSPGPSATPTASAAATQTLPKNGAPTAAIALSGLTFLEAGYGMTLAARRIGVRRRALPVYLMRKLIQAAREGQNEIALTDDVYLVRRTATTASTPPTKPTPPVSPTRHLLGTLVEDADDTMTELDVAAGASATHDTRSILGWVEWPFFTPSDHG